MMTTVLDLSSAPGGANMPNNEAETTTTTATLFMFGLIPTENPSFLLVQPHQHAFAMKFILAVQIAIVAGGLLANVLCIRTFFVMGLKDCVIITFFNLAVSDLSFLVVFSVDMAVKIHHTVYFGRSHVPPILGMDSVDLLTLVWKCHDPFVRTSLIFIAFLATQRSLCVVRPLQFKGMFTQRRTFTIVSVIWAYNLIFAAMQYSMLKIVKDPASRANESIFVMQYRAPGISSWMEFINDTTLTVICDIAVIGGLVVMTIALKSSVRFRQTSASFADTVEVDASEAETNKASGKDTSTKSRQFNKERQAIVQVTILAAVFLMAWIPNFILPIASAIEPTLKKSSYYFFRQICVQINAVFALLNASINLCVYYKYNTRFRDVLCGKKI